MRKMCVFSYLSVKNVCLSPSLNWLPRIAGIMVEVYQAEAGLGGYDDVPRLSNPALNAYLSRLEFGGSLERTEQERLWFPGLTAAVAYLVRSGGKNIYIQLNIIILMN